MKLLDEIVELFKKDKREVTRDSVSSWVTEQVRYGTHYAAKYGGLKQGDFSLYFREHYHEEA